MSLKAVGIKNFKVFSPEEFTRIELSSLTVLVGPNSSGKSSFSQFIDIVYNSFVKSNFETFYMDDSLLYTGGWDNVLNDPSKPLEFYLEFDQFGLTQLIESNNKNLINELNTFLSKFDLEVFNDIEELEYRLTPFLENDIGYEFKHMQRSRNNLRDFLKGEEIMTIYFTYKHGKLHKLVINLNKVDVVSVDLIKDDLLKIDINFHEIINVFVKYYQNLNINFANNNTWKSFIETQQKYNLVTYYQGGGYRLRLNFKYFKYNDQNYIYDKYVNSNFNSYILDDVEFKLTGLYDITAITNTIFLYDPSLKGEIYDKKIRFKIDVDQIEKEALKDRFEQAHNFFKDFKLDIIFKIFTISVYDCIKKDDIFENNGFNIIKLSYMERKRYYSFICKEDVDLLNQINKINKENPFVLKKYIGDVIVKKIDNLLFSIHLRKEKEINIIDVGSGVFRMMNLILLIHDSADKLGGLYLLEEPETNLHPKWQSLIADLIIELNEKSVSEYLGVKDLYTSARLIVETHSEYLLRRLQVLVANKTLSSEVVSIVYFPDPNEKQDKVRQIFIHPNGRLSQDFGPGFFDESTMLLVELMQYGGLN